MPDASRKALLALALAATTLLVTAVPPAAAASQGLIAETEAHLGEDLGVRPNHAAPGHGALPASYDSTENHGGDHGEAHGDPDLFAGSILQSLAAIVAFVLLLLILRKYAWNQILTGLQDREDKIKSDLEHAAGKHAEAQAVLDDYRNQLKGIQAEAQAKIDEARRAGEAVKVKLIADAEAHGARLRDRAEKEIAAAKETAIAEVYEKSAVLSTEIAAKILGREIDADAQQDLVSDSLREFESRMATNN